MSGQLLLTFDDGPHPIVTTCILDVLAKMNMTALFFVVGARLRSPAGRALARRAVAAGHVLGNHTFSHPNLVGMWRGSIRDELKRAHDLICECAGSCEVFRPPYGAADRAVVDEAAHLGYEILMWNVDSLDWKLRAGGTWVEHASTQLEGQQRAVVLMHDTRTSTAAGLPEFLVKISTDFVFHVPGAAVWPEFLLSSKHA